MVELHRGRMEDLTAIHAWAVLERLVPRFPAKLVFAFLGYALCLVPLVVLQVVLATAFLAPALVAIA
jgi:hypothetical protein